MAIVLSALCALLKLFRDQKIDNHNITLPSLKEENSSSFTFQSSEGLTQKRASAITLSFPHIWVTSILYSCIGEGSISTIFDS